MPLKKNILCFVLLPLLSGITLWLAWPPLPFTFLIFAGFIPLFYADELITSAYTRFTTLKSWVAVFTGLLIWNGLTTWWVCNSTVWGGIFANLANAILMTVPFMGYRYTKKYLGTAAGYLSFIVYWITFEYIHLRWELSWPWLTIGNVFALNHTWIQWYEYTGVFGGTVWVLLVNILLYDLLKKYLNKGKEQIVKKEKILFKTYLPHCIIIFLIALPIIFSVYIYNNTKDVGRPVNVTVVQPNFNPYTEKFSLPYDAQLKKMIKLSAQKVNDSTDYLVWPETAIPHPIWIDNIQEQKPVKMLKAFTDSFPNLTTIVGINGFQQYYSRADLTATSRQLINPRTKDTIWFDAYNTSVQIDTSSQIPHYNKSKLVPGVERMPYPSVFKFLEPLTINMGGISGSLGTQKERTPFFNRDSIGVATAICYESIYGEYMSRFINNGAQLIFIITNDGWWGNTSGHVQHYLYAKLRSIETRKSIARSANTGTSCFINQRGDISQPTAWEVDAVLNETIYANDIKTFYVKHGDYLGRIAYWIAVFLFVMSFIYKKIQTRRNKKNNLSDAKNL